VLPLKKNAECFDELSTNGLISVILFSSFVLSQSKDSEVF